MRILKESSNNLDNYSHNLSVLIGNVENEFPRHLVSVFDANGGWLSSGSSDNHLM